MSSWMLIHGDDTGQSRGLLSETLSTFQDTEIIRLDGEKVELADVSLALESFSLLAPQKTIVFENLLSKGTLKKKHHILEYVQKTNNLPTLIFWEPSKLTKVTLEKYFSGAKVSLCQLPEQLFKFLDSLGLVPSHVLVKSFKELVKLRDAELVFAMILRQIRLLLLIKHSSTGTMVGFAPWQLQKISRQANAFTNEQLLAVYRQLLLIDYKIKTGATPYNLEQLLDIYFISL